MKEHMMSTIVGLPKSRRTYLSDDRWPLRDCLVGVELEYENAHYLREMVENKCVYWTSTEDDSLRNNGREFLFSEPLSGVDLTNALDEMRAFFGQLNKSRMPDPHYRTSTHVHIDIRDTTISQYMNMILLSILFEPALFRFAGADRQRNNFSLSSRYSSGYFDKLSGAYNAESHGALYDALNGMFKYTAINISPPFVDDHAHPRKGSIEFRHHEGTLDMDKLSIWISILMRIKRAAVDETLFSEQWMHSLSAGHILDIMNSIFGAYTKYLVYEGMEPDLIDGVRLVQDIIHMQRLKSARALTELDIRMTPTKPDSILD